MTSTFTISCGTQKKTYQVNLSKTNNQKSFSYNKLGNKDVVLFNLSQTNYKTNDKNLFNKICTALDKLMTVGGNKNTIDDADFNKSKSNPNCKDGVWHNDDCVDLNNIDYHTDNEHTFFHLY